MSRVIGQTAGRLVQLKDLALRLDDFAEDFDPYGWMDSYDENENAIINTVNALAEGNKEPILEWLDECLAMLEPEEEKFREWINSLQTEVKAA